MARPPDGPGAAPAPSLELWTHEEGVQGVSSSHSSVPLVRRPASFSGGNGSGEGNEIDKNRGNNGNPTYPRKHGNNQQPFLLSTPRDRAGSADNSASFGYSRNGPAKLGAKMTSSDATWAECGVSAGGTALNGEGFPFLRRRRTFTEPTRSKRRFSVFANNDTESCGLGDRSGATTGSGRVPLSMSEDNMLSLVRKRPHESRAVSTWPEDQMRQPSCRAAVSNARRNTSVMRLHREGLVEDLARCVMDLVEGTAGAATATGGETVGSSLAATLEGVNDHLQSLPARYALSVDPKDVLTHMALFHEVAVASDRPTAADIPFPAATVAAPAVVGLRNGPGHVPPSVRVLVCPSRPSTAATDAAASCRSQPAAEVTPQGDVGSGGRSGSNHFGSTGTGSSGKSCERFSVTVVCCRGLLPLGAVSSALLSVGATCHDADVMSTQTVPATPRPVLSLARFEVDIAVGASGTFSSAARGASAGDSDPSAAAAAAAATEFAGAAARSAAGSQPRQRQTQEADEPHHRLASLLSSTITASIWEAGRQERQLSERESTIARGGIASQGGAGGLASDSSGVRCSQPPSWTPSAQATVVATSAVIAPSREEDGERASLPAAKTGSVEISRHLSHGRTERPPLARRQGEFFLAETISNALDSKDNSDAISFGGCVGDEGGSGGGGGGRSVDGHANPFSKSNNLSHGVALAEITGSGNPPNSNSNAHDGRRASSTINNDARNHSERFPTIPPGDIELLELVGKGRFSRTYMARWRGMTVAVKTLESPPPGVVVGGQGARVDAGGRSMAVAEFERELHIVRKLRHPNVCGFRGACVASPNQLSLVYNFLENGTLGDRLSDTGGDGASAGGDGGVGGVTANGRGNDEESRSRRQPKKSLSTADLVAIVKDVVDGMIYLHELGVLHRDLKPDNILLDADDRAVVADFGLATVCNPTNEHTAETGTYRWMAPEVIRHEPYSRPADVYSFGMVLWQVLTRRKPFQGLTPVQAAFSVASQGLRPQLPTTSPPALTTLIHRCWHRNPGFRPSFSQVRAELPEIERQMLSR